MSKQENILADYLDNVRFYSETCAAEALPQALKKVYQLAESRPDTVDESLVQAMDTNIRQLLKNMLTERAAMSTFPLLQRVLSIAEAVVMVAKNKSQYHKYQYRWQFARDVINDRKHELSIDKHRLAGRPKVKELLTLLAAENRVKREIIEKELAVSKQGASNIIRDLKALALIEEFTSSNDKRKKEYSLSDEGMKVCKDIGIKLRRNQKPAKRQRQSWPQPDAVRTEVHQAIVEAPNPPLRQGSAMDIGNSPFSQDPSSYLKRDFLCEHGSVDTNMHVLITKER